MNLFANEPKRELNLLGPQTPKDTKTTVLLLKLFTEAIFDSNNRPFLGRIGGYSLLNGGQEERSVDDKDHDEEERGNHRGRNGRHKITKRPLNKRRKGERGGGAGQLVIKYLNGGNSFGM